MTRKRRVLDLFCGGGGCSYGYYLAGYEVIGVDLAPHPRYPFEFHQADALTFPLDGFDLIHASPPCQAWATPSGAFRNAGKEYPELIEPIRERLKASGIPYVIENVIGAPLMDPVMLCGAMFGLRVYRHRLFETSFPVAAPSHPDHIWGVPRMGRKPEGSQMRTVVGHFSDVDGAKADMGISWMTGAELAQAIPPAYTRYIAQAGGSRQCIICDRWWSPKRADAKTCSDACRKKLSRTRRVA